MAWIPPISGGDGYKIKIYSYTGANIASQSRQVGTIDISDLGLTEPPIVMVAENQLMGIRIDSVTATTISMSLYNLYNSAVGATCKIAVFYK